MAFERRNRRELDRRRPPADGRSGSPSVTMRSIPARRPAALLALTEGDETFTVTLTPPAGWTEASLGVGTATVTITDVPMEPEEQVLKEPETVEIPGAVVNLQLSTTTDSITATLGAPQDGGALDGYVVRLDPADGSNDQVKQPGAGTTSVTFDGLEPGATYEVSVRAQNTAGNGEQVRATVTLPVPELEPPPDPTQEASDNGDGQCDGTLTLEDVLQAQDDFRAGKITEEELMEVLGCWDKQRGF